MSGTRPRTLPPLLIIAAPAGITTLWVLPQHHGWTKEHTAWAAAVVFLAVLALPRLPGWIASGAKTALKAGRKTKKKKKKDKSK